MAKLADSHRSIGFVAGLIGLTLFSVLLPGFFIGRAYLKKDRLRAEAAYERARVRTHIQSSAEYIEAGRLLLKAGQPQQAAMWLFRAYEQGERELALRHLLAAALQQSAALPVTLLATDVADGALSSDGRLAVLVDDRGEFTLHDVDSGRFLQTLETSSEPDSEDAGAADVQFLPDRKHIISLQKRSETAEDILLWHQPTPGAPFEIQYVIHGPDTGGDGITRTMLAADSRYLLVYAPGSWEDDSWSDVILYDLTTGKKARDSVEVGVEYGAGSDLYANGAAFSRDGSRILILLGGRVKIIETVSGKLIQEVGERGADITLAQLSPDQQRLLTVNKLGEVKVWQVSSNKPLFTLDLQKARTGGPYLQLNWLRKHDMFPALNARGDMELRDLLQNKIDVRKARAASAQYTRDGTQIAVRLNTGVLVHWDATTGSCASRRGGGNQYPPSESAAAEEPLADDVVSVEPYDQPRFLASIVNQPHSRTLTIESKRARVNKAPAQVAFTPLSGSADQTVLGKDGALVVQRKDRHEVLLESAVTGKTMARWAVEAPRSGSEIVKLALSEDGQRVAAAVPYVHYYEPGLSTPAQIKIWDVASQRLLVSIPLGEKKIAELTLSAAGQLVGIRDDKEIQIFDTTIGKLAHSYKQDAAQSLAFSPDDKFLAIGTDTGARVMELATGKAVAVWAGHRDLVTAMTFSPDGRSLVTVSQDWTAKVWSLEPAAAKDNPLVTFTGHQGTVTAATFSPDGALVVTLGTDRTARLWELRSGRELRVIDGGAEGFTSARFTASGTELRTVGKSGTALWNLAPESRPPIELAAWLRCYVPFAFVGNVLSRLPAREPLPAECWPR